MRGRMLALLALSELMAMSAWFTAAAVAPDLASRWELGTGEVGWLTAAVQAGFVAGTALSALLGLADRISSRFLFSACALLAALANALIVAAPGYRTALVLRLATGLFLAGVYPPAMKMIATWYSASRGLAIGTVVGALTLGKATPWLARWASGGEPVPVLLAASLAGVIAAALVTLLWRDGPHEFERRPFSIRLVAEVLADRPTRLAIGGYLGHMWELYAMWTWVPAFVAASLAARGAGGPAAADLIAFGAIAAGGAGCLWGGWMGDRRGRGVIAIALMAGSGLCCLTAPLAWGASPAVLAALMWAWGFLVVADSPLFSALVTQTAPRHGVGTALTLQTCLGFLLTVLPIQGIAALAGAAGWQYAFPWLALGPAAGIACIARLLSARRTDGNPSA